MDSDRRQSGQDRRQSQRILVDLEVDYQCEDTFLFAYITDMSAFGIFIRTNNPEPPGTHLNLRFKLPEESEPLQLEGEVIWINPYRPGDFNNINPGMGVKFVDLTAEVKDSLLGLIRKIAYLDDTQDDDPDADTQVGFNDRQDDGAMDDDIPIIFQTGAAEAHDAEAHDAEADDAEADDAETDESKN